MPGCLSSEASRRLSLLLHDHPPTHLACAVCTIYAVWGTPSLQVREQRVSNLLQSLLVAACLGITPAIQQIPTGVLWGYFMLLAVKSLDGSQLWERLLLMLTDPKKRVDVLQQEHAAFMQVRLDAATACLQRVPPGLWVCVGPCLGILPCRLTTKQVISCCCMPSRVLVQGYNVWVLGKVQPRFGGCCAPCATGYGKTQSSSSS